MKNNYFDIVNKLLENIDDIHITEDLKQEFITRTKKHIWLVNEYARKIGKSYPSHDSSKLGELLEPYSLYMKKDRTKAEDELLDLATLIHIKNSPHHPEYWTDTDLEGFTRKNYCPNGPINATDMDEDSMCEMLADWCSMSKELGTNTPFEWFKKVNGTRWIFSQSQQTFIINTLRKMWNEN